VEEILFFSLCTIFGFPFQTEVVEKSAASCNLPHFVYDFWFSIPNGSGEKKCGKLKLAALCA
jgi:hypothetical protein